MKLNDAGAFRWLGDSYSHGNNGLQKDLRKAFELYNRGAELGLSMCHAKIAYMYQGEGVEKDEEKSEHHLMLAAIGGVEQARHMFGDMEVSKGNMDRAMKHYMIAARCGYDESLKNVGEGYKAGHVTKDDYAKTMRAHKQSTEDMKSEQREIAAVMRCIV